MIDGRIEWTIAQLKRAIEASIGPSEAIQRIQAITAELTPEDRQTLWGWIKDSDPVLAAKLKAVKSLGKPLNLGGILAIEADKTRISLASQWYEDHKPMIQARLPLEIRDRSGGITLYQANWDISYWIQKWRASTLPILDADRFIPGQLGALVAVFDDTEVAIGRAA